ncbi:O-antigen ligase family protein [Paracoccus aerodenitrificans]|uniref:O-antigen ligase family protein n=1 Tax=Paracoccus aerodenitrificans TaxID=3017781 RepID=UPI0022F05773|nr:O-antigen ligase family protein [Paracoccus aerodenitrificans]WBU63487.1 O-antigen ligase family protein [Paracoccus aerodenitrificans]
MLVIMLLVATIFNDITPFLPVGEMAKDGFIYLFPIAFGLFLLRPRQIRFPAAFTAIFLIFIAVIVTGVVLNYDEISTAYFKGRSGMSRVITQGMVVVLGPLVSLLFYNLAHRGQMRDISRGAEITLWVMAVVGFLELMSWYSIPGLTQLYDTLSIAIHAGNEDYANRLRTAAFEASWAAVMVSFVFPFAMTRATPVKLVVYSLIVIAIMGLAQSRTAMLVIGIQFTVLAAAFFRHRKDYFIYGATVACLVAMAILTTPGLGQSVTEKFSNLIEYGSTEGLIDTTPGAIENASNVTRLAAIRAGMSMFRERPLIGVGFGQYGFHYPSHIHMDDMRSWEVQRYVTEGDTQLGWPPAYSLHVRMLSETGMLGYSMWLMIILPVLFRSLIMADGRSYLGRMHLAVAMILIGWMLLGVSIDSFRFFGGWIALGVGLALSRPPQVSGNRGVSVRSASAS